MALTKKEKLERAALEARLAERERELREARALSGLAIPAPAPGVRHDDHQLGDPPLAGWVPIEPHQILRGLGWRHGYAAVACTSKVGHAVGRADRTDAQMPRNLHSTRLAALLECDRKLRLAFAKVLGDVAAEILGEMASPTPLPDPEGPT